MKTTIPSASFDLQSLLNAVADFTDAVCGEEFQAATLATESEREELYDQDWDNLPRFEREHRFPELETKLKNGETLVLDIAEPYVGEPIRFVDGSKVDVGEQSNPARDFFEVLARRCVWFRLPRPGHEMSLNWPKNFGAA